MMQLARKLGDMFLPSALWINSVYRDWGLAGACEMWNNSDGAVHFVFQSLFMYNVQREVEIALWRE